MKQGIHPEYTEVTATCSCGNVATATRSTLVNNVLLILVAVLNVLTNVSASQAQNNFNQLYVKKTSLKRGFLLLNS